MLATSAPTTDGANRWRVRRLSALHSLGVANASASARTASSSLPAEEYRGLRTEYLLQGRQLRGDNEGTG